MALLALPEDERLLYEAIGYREKLDAVDEGIRRYALILRDSYVVVTDHVANTV